MNNKERYQLGRWTKVHGFIHYFFFPYLEVTFDLKEKPRTLDAVQEVSSLDQGTRPSPVLATSLPHVAPPLR